MNRPDLNGYRRAHADSSEQHIEAVVALGQRLAAERDPAALFADICATVRRVTRARYAAIGLFDESGTAIENLTASGLPDDISAQLRSLRLPLTTQLTTLISQRRSYRDTNAGGDPSCLHLPRQLPSVHSYLIVPMMSASRVCGFLVAAEKIDRRAFSDTDERVAWALATQTGIAYENADLLTALQASTDRLKQNEERMAFALEAARIRVWHRDVEDSASAVRSISQAPAINEVDGREPASDGTPHPDDVGLLRTAIDRAIRDRSEFNVEFRRVLPNRTVCWQQARGRITVDAGGAARQVMGVTIDTTERHALEAQLRQAQKMEAIGQLAGGIAHDFNNLLTAILGYSDVLVEMSEPATAQARAAGRIRQAGELAANLTRQLLTFSRRNVLQPEVLHVNTIVRRLEGLLGRLIGERVRLVTRLAESPGAVMVDPGHVEQLILNLAINARDAMPDGGTLTLETARVELDARPGVEPGPYTMLAVSDTGTGMDQKTLAHAFEPFFTTKERGQGTGLGLATVYGIVKQGNGFIGASSTPGAGTTFRIYLPSVADSTAATLTPPRLPRQTGHETILLVEDQYEVRDAAKVMLERCGYTVVEAQSGTDALERLTAYRAPIHLLLTDLVMPAMNGRELARHIIERRPDTRVLYMSGYIENGIMDHGVLERGVAFVQKPLTSSSLSSKVREVLDAPTAPSL